MNKYLKITAITIASVLITLYVLFLIVPPFINLDNYKGDIQKLVKDNSKLNLNYSKLKLYSTPMLSFGVILNEPDIKFDDGSTLLAAKKFKMGIALPSLLTLTVKTSRIHLDEPVLNLEIDDGSEYKIVKIIEDIINENNAKPKVESVPNPYLDKLVSLIRYKVPAVLISDYKVKVSDPQINHSLTLKGDKLKLGYTSAKNLVSAKTKAELLSDDNTNIKADIKISSSIPTSDDTSKEELDPEEKIDIPFINIVEIYQTYDLKTDITSRLKIRQIKGGSFIVNGFLNADNLNLKLSDIRLPDSFIHTKFSGKKVDFDCDINALQNENVTISGMMKYSKHPKMRLELNSDKIHFDNLLNLTVALLDSLNINHNLAQIKATGYLIANAKIRTNFKKLKSQGDIIIKDGSFINPQYNIGIKDIILNADFNNNSFNLKNSSMTINGSQLKMNGEITNKAKTNIKIDVDKLSLVELYHAFAPKEVKKLYDLTSAILTAHIDVSGKLDKLNINLKTILNKLALNDSKKTMFVSNDSANVTLKVQPEGVSGEFKNSKFAFKMPDLRTQTLIDELGIDIKTDAIIVKPFNVTYNNISKINIKGNIKNYLKEPDIDIFADGKIQTSTLAQTLGADAAHYMKYSGTIPVKARVNGNSKVQNILIQTYSDLNNYISPVILDELYLSPSIIQAEINLKGDSVRVKHAGIYKKLAAGFSDNLEQNLINTKQIAELSSIIYGNHINLFRIHLLRDLKGKIAIFDKSSFIAKGKIILTGYFDNINYSGNLKLENLDIPEILLKIKQTDLDFSSHYFNLKLNEISANESKVNVNLRGDLAPSRIFKIDNLYINSNLIDIDKAVKVSEKLEKYMPSQPKTASKNQQSADIALSAEGRFDIKKITTGQITVDNSRGNLFIRNNNLYISDLNSRAFKGVISGDIIVNLINQLITIRLNGSRIDANEMLVQAANMKDTLSGVMNFRTDISLMGATYLEQVKSLKGSIWFNSKQGVYGPFSKLENFFLAENIRENPVFKNTIGVILSPITRIDSSHYEELNGRLDFKNGVVRMNPITSRGNILCILIKGDMNLVDNTINSFVRVRLASAVSDLLGPLALANPINLVKNTPGLNVATAKLFSIFSQVVDEKEYAQIPDFSSKHKDSNATKFQIILKGDVAKPLKLVKSFKWLALQKDMDAAQEFSDKFVKEQEELAKQEMINKMQKEYENSHKTKVKVQKILRMDTTAPEVKDFIFNEVVESYDLKSKNEQSSEK